MARIYFRPQVRTDLEDIADYIAEQAGDDRARIFLRKIYSQMQIYASQPKAGRNRDELKQGMRSFVHNRYVVFYQPVKDGIMIIRVLHGSRDLNAIDYDEDDQQQLTLGSKDITVEMRAIQRYNKRNKIGAEKITDYF